MLTSRQGWRWLCMACLAEISCALLLTYPTNETTWARDEALQISWTSSSDDPSNITIILVNEEINPGFSKTYAEGWKASINSFNASADLSIPAGAGYQIELVQRTNISDKVMAISPEFSVAESHKPNSRHIPALAIIIGVVALIVVIIIAGSLWICWVRKRRWRTRIPSRSPTVMLERKSSLFPGSHSQRDSKAPTNEEKPTVEEPAIDDGSLQRKSTHLLAQAAQDSIPRLLLPQPPPEPTEETAEMPLFVTPRSSRHVNPQRRARPSEEFALDPRPPRPKSVDETRLAEAQPPWPRAARSSQRISLQQIIQPEKVAEVDGKPPLPPHPSERSAQLACPVGDSNTSFQRSSTNRRFNRLSLQHFLQVRHVAELEGSLAVPGQPSTGRPNLDEEAQNSTPRRANRLSLHRLLHSRRLAELEANTDTLPEYSHTDQNLPSHTTPPPLPPKDADFKEHYHHPRSVIRALSPIELDASEPQTLSATSLSRALSTKSRGHSTSAHASSSQSSPYSWNREADKVKVNQNEEDGLEEVQIGMAKSPVGSKPELQIPQTNTTMEFLDVASTESEGAVSNRSGSGGNNAQSPSGSSGAPFLSRPPKKSPIDPSLTAEIISAAVEASRTSPLAPQFHNDPKMNRKEEELSPLQEMDATETAVKRRSRKQNSFRVSRGGEGGLRRGPDFITFKKQMTEAERRAKMIAKRRSRRRMTRSF